jgi:chaperonin cofactor prefoldin
MTIHEWLRNPSDFETGRQLYDKYGTLQALKKAFARGELYENLVYELGKIAEGIPELPSETKTIVSESKKPVLEISEDDLIIIENERDEAVERVEELEEQVDDLTNENEELTDELQDLKEGIYKAVCSEEQNQKLRPLYNERSFLHNNLELLSTDKERYDSALRIEELTDQIEKILNPPSEPPVKELYDFTHLSPEQKLKELQNIRSRISKQKKNKKRADDVAVWMKQKQILEKELGINQ